MAILEHGLPLSDPLVLATVADLKTMTRRVVLPQPSDNVAEVKEHSGEPGYFVPYLADGRLANGNTGNRVNDCGYRSPYGPVGSLLYIRQVWGMSGWLSKDPSVCFRADGAQVPWTTSGLPRGNDGALLPSLYHKTWMPGRFMPKAFAHNWVQITGLRAERVQDISEEDAEAEGVLPAELGKEYDCMCLPQGRAHICTFIDLWDSLNANRGYSWKSNSWVWVILYRLVSTTGRDAALLAVAPSGRA